MLRVDLGGDPTVAEMLARVRARSLEAFEHQDVPFEVLVERLNPTRSLTHHPLFQVALGWQNFAENRGDPTAAMALGDVQISPLDADIQTARWDLTFQLAERFTEAGQPAGIGGWWSFAPMSSMRPVSRFWRRGCVGCLRRWLLIRAGICRALMCSMTLSTLSSMGGATGLRSTSPRRCGGRFRRCSPSRWPPPRSDSDHLRRAVADHAEVDAASNRLAHYLVDRGVGPGGVGVLLPRSAEAIVAIWRCSSAGRLMCRSIRPIPMNGSASCSPMPRRWW